MSGGVVCYLERELGGSSIRRIRLVAAGLSRTWSAPEPQALASDSPANDGPGAALAAAHGGVRWIIETLQSVGLKRLAALCLDADGGVCTWLSAPSPDHTIIHASIMQAAQDAGSADSAAAGLGAGRLLAMAFAGGALGSGSGGGGGAEFGIVPDTSVQALADESPDAMTSQPRGPRKRSARSSPNPGVRNRYAVLAVPDAPARVVLDELDAAGISVDSVLSIWHAAARAWGGVPSGGQGTGMSPAGINDVAEADAPTTAVILVDPLGKLLWSWSRGTNLLAGGSLRLSRVRRRQSDARPSASDSARASGFGSANASASDMSSTSQSLGTLENARRLALNDAEPDESDALDGALEFSAADAGRLAMDWLAWSVQLGASPQRLVCLGTPNLTDNSIGGVAALARACGRIWPGSTIDAVELNDPIASTIARLAGLGDDDQGLAGQAGAVGPSLSSSSSAQSGLVGLSSRAGRADRGMYRFAAIALSLAGLAIGVVGWRLNQAADLALAASEAARGEFTEAMTAEDVKNAVPDLAATPGNAKKIIAIQEKVAALRDQASKVRPPRPVLVEAVRVVNALQGFEGVKLTEFDFLAAASGSVNISVPDAETGPSILTKLNASPGVLTWTGIIPSGFGSTAGQRQYRLTAIWPADSSQARTGGSTR